MFGTQVAALLTRARTICLTQWISTRESKYCGSESGCCDPEARAAVSRAAANMGDAPYAPLGRTVRRCPAPARRYAARLLARGEAIFQRCRSAGHEKRCRTSPLARGERGRCQGGILAG